MWRITDDFWDNWELLKNMFWRCELWQNHVDEGCYPDCDMLPLGKIGKGFGNGERSCSLTHDEQRTMMTLWCMFRSPLMIGAELTKIDDWTLSLITNKDVLDMLNCNCKGIQLERTDKYAVWKNYNSSDKTTYIGLFNLSEADNKISVNIGDKDFKLYELWDKTTSNAADGLIEAVVPAHGVKVYKVS
jgi:hypothetical protein